MVLYSIHFVIIYKSRPQTLTHSIQLIDRLILSMFWTISVINYHCHELPPLDITGYSIQGTCYYGQYSTELLPKN